MPNKGLGTVYLTVREKENILFEDEIMAITSFNEKGIFDILPLHENFISIIKNSVIIHKKGGKREVLKIESGILKVFENRINIYLGIRVSSLQGNQLTIKQT